MEQERQDARNDDATGFAPPLLAHLGSWTFGVWLHLMEGQHKKLQDVFSANGLQSLLVWKFGLGANNKFRDFF